MTEFSQQGGAFAAMLGAVIDQMDQALPEGILMRLAAAFIGDRAVDLFIAQVINIATQGGAISVSLRSRIDATVGKSSAFSQSISPRSKRR